MNGLRHYYLTFYAIKNRTPKVNEYLGTFLRSLRPACRQRQVPGAPCVTASLPQHFETPKSLKKIHLQ